MCWDGWTSCNPRLGCYTSCRLRLGSLTSCRSCLGTNYSSGTYDFPRTDGRLLNVRYVIRNTTTRSLLCSARRNLLMSSQPMVIRKASPPDCCRIRRQRPPWRVRISRPEPTAVSIRPRGVDLVLAAVRRQLHRRRQVSVGPHYERSLHQILLLRGSPPAAYSSRCVPRPLTSSARPVGRRRIQKEGPERRRLAVRHVAAALVAAERAAPQRETDDDHPEQPAEDVPDEGNHVWREVAIGDLKRVVVHVYVVAEGAAVGRARVHGVATAGVGAEVAESEELSLVSDCHCALCRIRGPPREGHRCLAVSARLHARQAYLLLAKSPPTRREHEHVEPGFVV
mmetsp:Transcript_13741/g.33832  ORF Transcript_13741/g.33832 Transcript_13741/m.33832 type:complete len:339 (-) Transcript_13741:1410-2426(-)